MKSLRLLLALAVASLCVGALSAADAPPAKDAPADKCCCKDCSKGCDKECNACAKHSCEKKDK